MRIHPFTIAIGDEEIADLERRLAQTRWPPMRDAGWDMGMDGQFLRELVRYWLHDFDWRRVERSLNGIPQFQAVAASGTIHFAHVKSNVPGAMPIVLTHGWPGHFADFRKTAAILATPPGLAHGADEAFDVVIPSLPGYGFSEAPTRAGHDVFAIADQWSELMDALGYSRFMAHGGDIGASISTALGLRHPERLIGIHLNYIPGSYQPHVTDPGELGADEKEFLRYRAAWLETEGGYSHVQGTKPDTLGPGLNDSPVGLAAWIVDKFRSWSDCDGDVLSRFSCDELLTSVCLYWFTRSMPSAIRLYWEIRKAPLRFAAGERVEVPVAVAHFPREIPIPPRRYVERGYNVTRWTELKHGGHFAALEEPDALAGDIRSFSRRYR